MMEDIVDNKSWFQTLSKSRASRQTYCHSRNCSKKLEAFFSMFELDFLKLKIAFGCFPPLLFARARFCLLAAAFVYSCLVLFGSQWNDTSTWTVMVVSNLTWDVIRTTTTRKCCCSWTIYFNSMPLFLSKKFNV